MLSVAVPYATNRDFLCYLMWCVTASLEFPSAIRLLSKATNRGLFCCQSPRVMQYNVVFHAMKGQESTCPPHTLLSLVKVLED